MIFLFGQSWLPQITSNSFDNWYHKVAPSNSCGHCIVNDCKVVKKSTNVVLNRSVLRKGKYFISEFHGGIFSSLKMIWSFNQKIRGKCNRMLFLTKN
jgi:hypothetical protein